MISSARITRITGDKSTSCDDAVVREEPIDLSLNGEHFLTLVCLPYDLEAFAVGFLVTEGILKPPYESEFTYEPGSGRLDVRGRFENEAVRTFFAKRTLTSGCGGGVTAQDPVESRGCLKIDTQIRISVETISNFMGLLKQEASLYRLTGGAHIAALADRNGKLLATAQDIGRHTAVDKAIGKALLNGIDLTKCVLYCSGRLSSEITTKAIHARTPFLISRAAPTDLSVRLARRFLLTLVGFARGNRMNIYSVPERIVV